MAQKMDRGARQMKTDNIYENSDSIRGKIIKDTGHSITTRLQPPELTGRDLVWNRSSRAAAVCLVLLCVLLMTAVIVLCVIRQLLTQITNLTEEKDQLLTQITNLTEEKDQLLTQITNLTEEKDQLLTQITNLTEETLQLLTKITNLTKQRDLLQTKNTKITEEKQQVLTNITNLKDENYQLLTQITNLKEERDQLLTKMTNLTEERKQLIVELLMCCDRWFYNQSSLYFISSETKSWTESRRYCTERGADLIIINNREEPKFVENIMESGMVHVGYGGIWIGLTDSDEEDTWKWVDGSTLTSGFWYYLEPNGYRGENCVLTHSSGWAVYPCNYAFKCICEKHILLS